jgi:CRISPR type III-A-associated RAMP protein Csm5
MTLRALTPVHVGSGEELAPSVEILGSGDRTYVLEIERLLALEALEPERLAEAFAAGAERRSERLLELLRAAGIDPASVSRYVLQGGWMRGRLRAQLRSADGSPLVPGSSVKGSLRTLALATLLGTEPGGPSPEASARVRSALERSVSGGRERASSVAWRAVEEPAQAPRRDLARGVEGSRRDLFRAVACSDAAFAAKDLRLVELSVQRGRPREAGEGGGERPGPRFLGPPIGAEAIAEGARSRIRVGFDAWLLDAGASLWGPARVELGWEALARASQARARSIVQREARRWRELGWGRAAERLERLADAAFHPEAVVLRLGFGIGWEATTGGLLDAEARDAVRRTPWIRGATATWSGTAFPSSRKLVRAVWRRDDAGLWQAFEAVDLPLGWMVLEPIDAAAPPAAETQGVRRGERREWGPREDRAAARGPRDEGRGEREERPGRREERPGRRDERGRGHGAERGDRRGRREDRAAPPPAERPLRPGDEVRAVVLEERTKKGALRFRIEPLGREAYLQPGGPAPPDDLQPGAAVRLLVRAVPASKGEAIACHWVAPADAPGP